MNETQNLKLPLLRQGQLNKDITVNEALTLIDSILNSGLESLNPFNIPPSDLEDGTLILVGNNPLESFEGFENTIAFYNNGWNFLKPKEGLILWVKDIKALSVFDGKNFIKINAPAGLQQENSLIERIEALEKKLDQGLKNQILSHNGQSFAPSSIISEVDAIGINSKADTVRNKLSVKSDSNLFTTETGDTRFILNKENERNTASFLFQTNWQGRAEFGSIGNDNFILKVSKDGISWIEVFEVDALTGKINFKQDVLKNGVKMF